VSSRYDVPWLTCSRVQLQQGVSSPTHHISDLASFGINGFRVAAIISQHNKLVLRALYHTAFLMKGA